MNSYNHGLLSRQSGVRIPPGTYLNQSQTIDTIGFVRN